MSKPNYTSLLAQLGALQADVDDIDAQMDAQAKLVQAYAAIANDPNSTAAEAINATQNGAIANQTYFTLLSSRPAAVSLVESKEEEAYQFPEPLTAAEEDLFNYMSTDYLESNPGSHPPQYQMEVLNDTLTLITASLAAQHQGNPEGNPVPDGLLGGFFESPNTFTPNYVDGSTNNFLLWLTEEPLIEDAGAHIGAIMTLSSGSNELKLTITGITADSFGDVDIYNVDFEVSPHKVVGLSYFENLSYNDTLNIKIESPSKSSYVGKYYDDDGIIG
jgi:hypothetical protein